MTTNVAPSARSNTKRTMNWPNCGGRRRGDTQASLSTGANSKVKRGFRFPYGPTSAALRGVEKPRGDPLDLAVVFELDDWPNTMDYRGVSRCRDPQFDCVQLFDDPYLLVLPADHPLAAQETIALAQLTGERVLVSSPWERTLRRICADAGVEPEFDCSCQGTGFEALQALVSIGHGLTFMPRLSLGWVREALVARPVGPDLDPVLAS